MHLICAGMEGMNGTVNGMMEGLVLGLTVVLEGTICIYGCCFHWGCMVGCGFHSIGGSSFTPSTCPHIPDSSSTSCPRLPILIFVTHHCPTKHWQLLTNGLHCLLCVSCPRRQWQTRGSEEESKKKKGAGSPRSSKAPGTGGWKSILIRLLIGSDSTRAVECGNPLCATHIKSEWRRKRKGEKRRGWEAWDTRYSTLSSWHFDNETRTQSESMQV